MTLVLRVITDSNSLAISWKKNPGFRSTRPLQACDHVVSGEVCPETEGLLELRSKGCKNRIELSSGWPPLPVSGNESLACSYKGSMSVCLLVCFSNFASFALFSSFTFIR